MDEQSVRKVVMLGTGGTISGRAADGADNLGYTSGQVGIGALASVLPPALAPGVCYVTEQVAQADSKDMGPSVWRELAARCAHFLAQRDVLGLVITHGTDTMEETAFFLHRVLAHAGVQAKPVVLTGAMRPASALAPDGPQNMRDAVSVAVAPGACGVMVVMAGTVFAATDVQKVDPYRLQAFDAGDAGPLGYVEEGRARMVRPWPSVDAVPGDALRAVLEGSLPWPRVEIVTSHAGAGAWAIDAMLAHGGSVGGSLRGLVIAGTGNGTVHQDLEAAALRARSLGVAVVRGTRCVRGRVLPTAHDELPDSGGLSPVKARIALQLQLLCAGGATV